MRVLEDCGEYCSFIGRGVDGGADAEEADADVLEVVDDRRGHSVHVSPIQQDVAMAAQNGCKCNRFVGFADRE